MTPSQVLRAGPGAEPVVQTRIHLPALPRLACLGRRLCVLRGRLPGRGRWAWQAGPQLRFVPAVQSIGPFQFQDSVDGQLQGRVELTGPGQGGFSGGAAVSGSSSASMNVCTLRVDPNTWVDMLQER